MAGEETRTRIIEAAAQVFSQRGFDRATLKEITSVADANIAAVNYHFRSKEDLIRQVIADLLRNMNASRALALGRWEEEVRAGQPLRLEPLLEALVRPMVEAARDTSGGRSHIGMLMQVRASPSIPGDLVKAEDVIHDRFVGALALCLPHLTRAELIWRYNCARGAMIYLLADMAPGVHRIVNLTDRPPPVEDERIIQELVRFIAGGLRAPCDQA